MHYYYTILLSCIQNTYAKRTVAWAMQSAGYDNVIVTSDPLSEGDSQLKPMHGAVIQQSL